MIDLAALYWCNNPTDDVTIVKVDGRRTWIVEPGDRMRLCSDEVGPDDWYRCVGRAGVTGTPEPLGGTGSIPVTRSACQGDGSGASIAASTSCSSFGGKQGMTWRFCRAPSTPMSSITLSTSS